MFNECLNASCVILIGMKSTGNMEIFDDIIKGQVQMHHPGDPRCVKKGMTLTKSVELHGAEVGWDEDNAGQVNSTLHILEIGKCSLPFSINEEFHISYIYNYCIYFY